MSLDKASGNPGTAPEVPRLARVVGFLDPNYMGGLQVQLLKEVNSNNYEGQVFQVRMMTPFAGQTSGDFVKNVEGYDNTQKSYGFWGVPPDVGTFVLVIFVNGDASRGFWIGCVPDDYTNFMIPGIAATQFTSDTVETDSAGNPGRVPVAEFNKVINKTTTDASKNPTKVNKPQHPLADVLSTQGLLFDDTRGITSSSGRREVPSLVFGMSTPGPVDKGADKPRDKVGVPPNQQVAPVSRLGGTTFVMDDGNDKFIRTAAASDGPPEYVPAGGDSGDVGIPHNELVRIRTRTGHQILLHNSEDLIYIGNSKGTTWIELTSNGKIDIYANDSVSVHTTNDFNVTADRDINLNAGGNINLNAGNNFYTTAVGEYHIKAGTNGYLTASGGNTNINSSGNHLETASKIYMNSSPAATPATSALIPTRVPQAEPWGGHENLDPQSVTPTNTKAGKTAASASPTYLGKYTTPTDAFDFVPPTGG